MGIRSAKSEKSAQRTRWVLLVLLLSFLFLVVPLSQVLLTNFVPRSFKRELTEVLRQHAAKAEISEVVIERKNGKRALLIAVDTPTDLSARAVEELSTVVKGRFGEETSLRVRQQKIFTPEVDQ